MFVLGLFLGAVIGVGVMCLISISKKENMINENRVVQ